MTDRGSVEDINWALERDYRVHIKDYSGSRAAQLAKSVSCWFSDPADPARQFGWVTAEASAYVHFYDQRGGGIEIEIKEDKQGLSTTRRNKKTLRRPANAHPVGSFGA